MNIKVIKEGDNNKKGSHVCPKCGEVVYIENQWGDPPKCSCGTYYTPILNPPTYIS